MTRARLVTGEHRVTMRVVQGVRELYVLRLTAAVRAYNDIMGPVVNTCVMLHVKTVQMAPSVQCVLLVNMGPYVPLHVTVTAAPVIL